MKNIAFGLKLLIFPILSLIFLALKFANLISWSWTYIFAPLWMPAALIITLMIISIITSAIAATIVNLNNNKHI